MTTTYEVRSGDTLGAIAQRHETSVTRLMNLNPEIENPDRIFAGQNVKIPANEDQFNSQCAPNEVADNASCEDEIAELIYVTESEELLLVTEGESEEIAREEDYVCAPIEAFYEDLASLDEGPETVEQRPEDSEGEILSPLQERKEALVRELAEREVLSGDIETTPQLTEIVRLSGNRHVTYVRSDRMKNHTRRYSMNARDRDRSQGWLTHEGIDKEKLQQALDSELRVGFRSEFWSWSPDEDNRVVEALNTFHGDASASVWGDEEAQEENRDRTGFDASAEAQWMRFTAGTSSAGTYNPEKGQVHFQAKTEALFTLLEGKATIEQAFPANNQSEIRIYYRIGGWDGERAYESLGHFQARLHITASGFAGASVLVSANVHVGMDNGVPELKGVAQKEDNPRNQTGAQGSAFAGVRAGCEVGGGLYWIDVLEHNQDWQSLCEVGKRIDAAAGFALEGELQVQFNRDTGKFLFNAHAGLVFGVGASGNFLMEVDVNHIQRMIHFIYNSLLEVDFRYLEIFDRRTDAFDNYAKYILFAIGTGVNHAMAASEVVATQFEVANQFWDEFVSTQAASWAKERKSVEIARNIIGDAQGCDSVLLHAPPEVKGQLLDVLMHDFWLSPRLVDGTRDQVKAITEILKSFQSWRDFEETMQRVNPEGRAQPDQYGDNIYRVFDFIGMNQNHYSAYEAALKDKKPFSNEPVRKDPHGACMQIGLNQQY